MKKKLDYHPKPIDTHRIELSNELKQLIELLAKNAHDLWARRRLQEGWTWGPERNDTFKKHPCLIPYEKLPENEKEYDRVVAMETIKVIISFGFTIKNA